MMSVSAGILIDSISTRGISDSCSSGVPAWLRIAIGVFGDSLSIRVACVSFHLDSPIFPMGLYITKT